MTPDLSARLTWYPTDTQAAVMLTMVTFTYLVYHYGLSADRFRRRWAGVLDPDQVEIRSVVWQRVLGGLLLGSASIATIWFNFGHPLGYYGLSTPHRPDLFVWVAVLTLILVPILKQAARRPRHWQTYPQMRITHWDRHRWWTNTVSWGIYLLGYETFFRGVLMYWLIQQLGWYGILMMNALYTFAHLNKDAGEAFGSALMGILFAVMTAQTGSIWAAFLVHWLIATCSETFAIQANPALHTSAGH